MNFAMIDAAVEKLNAERTLTAADQKAKAVASATADALIGFCRQSDAFAKAVVEGGSFEECCKAIMARCGNAISDFEVYSRAVKHYLPDATVEFEMRIITQDTSASGDSQTDNIINLSLADFL
jgi:hypothetical protein